MRCGSGVHSEAQSHPQTTRTSSPIHRPRALPVQEVEMDGDFDWHNSRRTRRCQHGCVSGFHENRFVIAN